MRVSFATILSLLFAITQAQTDTSIFKVLKGVETNEYFFKVPERWKEVPQVEASPIDEKFDFTNVGIPFKVHDAPLTAFLVLKKLECDSIGVGEKFCIDEFSSYSDRITAAGESYDTDSLTITSGERATLIHSRFYRRSKVSNFSVYNLVAHSTKRNACFILSITYKYKDATYMTEADLHFRQYSTRIFETLSLR